MPDQDLTARRAALEATVADRKQEAGEIRRQAQANLERVNQLRDELAARPADEFRTDGSVQPKTEAARLHAKLQAAENPPVPWSRREADATKRVTTAERELTAFVVANVAELVKAREAEGAAIDRRILDAAGEFSEAVVAKNRFGASIAQMIAPCSGLDAHTEIRNTDKLGQLRIQLNRLIGEGVPSSMPRSICPPEGETPPRVETEDGWVGIQHLNVKAEREAKREQQEERERKTRRPIRVRPPQPTPSLQTESELYRRGWEPR